MDLDQNSNYEWIWTFWFPDGEKDRLSGKVTYSPEQGIKLKLMFSGEHGLIHDVNNGFLSKATIFTHLFLVGLCLFTCDLILSDRH